MRPHILVSLFLLGCACALAQKVKTVEAEYIFHAPENYTLEQAKRTAIERARIQAIANVFGTSVTQTNVTSVSTSKVDFHTVGLSEVKGEWIEDIKEPLVDVALENGLFVIKVAVKGKARELKVAEPDCLVRILRNGKEDRDESDEFFNMDQFYISFQSPSNGAIAVYLSDNNGTVSCLLPYPEQSEPNFPVKANKKYLLFDPEQGGEAVEEYYLTCGTTSEVNQIYVVFSPNKFTKALDHESTGKTSELQLPRELTEVDFQKWLAKCRRRDNEMQVIRKYITIQNQQ